MARTTKTNGQRNKAGELTSYVVAMNADPQRGIAAKAIFVNADEAGSKEEAIAHAKKRFRAPAEATFSVEFFHTTAEDRPPVNLGEGATE